MRSRFVVSMSFVTPIALGVALGTGQVSMAQVTAGRPVQADRNHSNQVPVDASDAQERLDHEQAENELRMGTALTYKGLFSEAIPHLLAARGRVSNEYAAGFNLAICYVGTRESKPAIQTLNDLRRAGHAGADVENLLAQAYVGNGQPSEALASFERAAALTPQNEKLYLFVADACMDHRDYALGLKVVDAGLQNLPESARLHYEHGMFLSQLDAFDRATEDFQQVRKLAPESEIGYLSAAHEELLRGNLPEAIQSARDGINKGFESPILLTILGEALLRSGVSPGQPGFSEAQDALERSVAERPNDASSRLSLGKLYLAGGRVTDAIAHLERARELEPGMLSIYANLAKAYQRKGNLPAAQDALAMLEKLNRDQAERIRSAPGDRKMSYGGSTAEAAAEAYPK